MLTQPAGLAVVALAAQRLGELALSKRHEGRLRQLGAVEHAHGHHRSIVLLHAGWLLSVVLETRQHRQPAVLPALTFLAAQLLRYWCMVTLGPRWTTTIMVLPDVAPIRVGPYRWLNHPNYVAVAAEIAAFPLIFRAPRTALVFSMANAVLMRTRIRAENAALRAAGSPAQPLRPRVPVV